MREARLEMWLAVIVAVASVLGAGSMASGMRWEMSVQLASVGLELTATSERARIAVRF